MRELVALDGEYSANEVSLWEFDELVELISESGYGWTAYSGAGDAPYAIEISKYSWAY